jgi:protein CpxP
MKNRSLIAAAILAAGVLVAAPFAFAQHRGAHEHGGGFGEGMMFGRLQFAQKALSLSDDQVAQIKTIVTDLKAQNAPYRDSLKAGRQGIFKALIANPNDLAGAQALIDQQSTAEHTMKTNVLNAASKALNVLTAEQRAKLSTLVQERMARRANR